MEEFFKVGGGEKCMCEGGQKVQLKQEDRCEVRIHTMAAFTHTQVTLSENANPSSIWQHVRHAVSSYPALQPQAALD